VPARTRLGPPGYAPAPAPSSFGATHPAAVSTGGGGSQTIQMQCPDTLVGSIVGRGGSVIVEMQRQSGARIQISQKGEYVPGTTDRSITITGSDQACQMARYLVQQRIDGKRMRTAGGPSYGAKPPSYPTTPSYGAPAYGAASSTYPPSSSYNPGATYAAPGAYSVPSGTYQQQPPPPSYGTNSQKPYGTY
jgi:Polyribonucleotide nucleotidyltransferase (polynucleotide phosphorylase)